MIVAALPFRIPIQAGATTSNLLVPLYLVVAAGVLAFAIETARAPGVAADTPVPTPPRPPDPPWRGASGRRRWVARLDSVWASRLLALYIALYAVQATYSPDFE